MNKKKEKNQRCVYLKTNSDISSPLFNLKFDANHKTRSITVGNSETLGKSQIIFGKQY